MIAAFRIAVAVALVHALDDAFWHRGAHVGPHWLAAVIAVVATVAAAVAFRRLRPGAQAATAFAFGALAIVNGATHAVHATAGDATGLLALAAGVTLAGLAVTIPWRRRGSGTAVSRAAAVVGGVLGLWFVVVPLAMGIVSAHKWREPVGRPPSAAYHDVAFAASDGVRLKGWYRPSHNGTAVVIVHGGGSDRRGGVRQARLLARHGYGVLLYDARGRGQSQGAPNDYGWGWAKDLDAAIGWLQRRDDVDRVAGLGLSTGADVLLDVAGRRGDLAAVITDGAAAGSFEDVHRVYGTSLDTPPAWLMFAALRVVSADPPGHAIEDELRRLRSPTLLISAGTSMERDFNRHYDAVGGAGVEHWNLPGADHTAAVRQAPAAYERRVTEFLRRALG